GEADQSAKRHERALGVIRHPEPLSTAHTLLAQRRQTHLSLCWGTGISSGHLQAPSFRFLDFLPLVSPSRQDRLAILGVFLAREITGKNHLQKPLTLRV